MRFGIRLGPFSISQRIGGGRRRRRRRSSRRARTWTHPGCHVQHRSQGAAERCRHGVAVPGESFERAARREALQELEVERTLEAQRTARAIEVEEELDQLRAINRRKDQVEPTEPLSTRDDALLPDTDAAK